MHEDGVSLPPLLVCSAEGVWFYSPHRPGKAQTPVNGLSQLSVEQAPPEGEEAALVIQLLAVEEAAWHAARELHNATHVGVAL